MERYVEYLTDAKRPLTSSRLASLSHLSPEEVALFKEAWPRIAVERRRAVMNHLSQLAEEDLELDFDPVFRLALEDPDPEVCLKAIHGVADSEDRCFISPLIRLMGGPGEVSLRAAAAGALRQFVLLAELGKLRPSDGERMMQALLAIIEEEKEPMEVRRRALEAISPLSHERARQVILAAYDNSDFKFRASALYAMGQNCDPRFLPLLLKELQNPEPELRYEAAQACGELEDEEAVSSLLPLLQDSDDQVRLSAIEALGQIGGDMAKKELKRCLEHQEPAVREAAREAMRQIHFREEPLSLAEDSDDL